MKKKQISFETDLMSNLRDPEFASIYIMSAVVENDLGFIPIALGDVAKAHGISKLAEKTGINRRTLYKVFNKVGNPSFEMVVQIADGLGLEMQVQPKKIRKKRIS